MSKSLRLLPIKLTEPTILEGWQLGNYLVTAVFPKGGDLSGYQEIREAGAGELAQARSLKKGVWPRGIALYYLVPIHTLVEGEFSAALREAVYQGALEWRYSVYLEPVLVELATGRVTLRRGFENPRFMYSKHILRVLLSYLASLGQTAEASHLSAFDLNSGAIRLPIRPQNV